MFLMFREGGWEWTILFCFQLGVLDPNPYPFLDPGRVIPGNAGGPGPGRRAHPETQTHWGGYAPPDPPSGFFGTGGVQRHIFLASYSIIPHPASYFINVICY